MSTAALDRQHRWRCRLQDLSPHLQPPTPKGQLPQPSASPFPPRKSSCFPSYATSLLNSNPLQFCFLPSNNPALGVSCSLLSPTPAATNSDNQESDLDPQNTFVHRRSFPGSLPATSQVYLLQDPICGNNNRGDHPEPATLRAQITTPLPNLPLSYDTLPHGYCSQKLDQTTGAPVTCTAITNMHAQTTKESLVVNTLGNLNVTQRRCTSGDMSGESGLTCHGHFTGTSSTCNGGMKHNETIPQVHATGTSNTSAAYISTHPSTYVENINSSSVPKSLQSYACHSGTRVPLFTLSIEPSTEKPSSKKYTIIETRFKKCVSPEPANQISNNDSNIPSASLSNNNNNNNNNDPPNPLKEEEGAGTALPTNERVFNRELMRGSLTTEEESSSFDSGQDESPDSSKKSPCPRSRKKRPGGYHSHQENHLLPQEKLDRQSEEDLTRQEESVQIERLKGTMPCNKLISRANAGGKYKVTGCCSRRRLIDDEGYIRRAASICVNKEETQVLLVSSKKDRCAWLVPGGGLEVGEDEAAAAVREAWEEAGVLGHIARYLGLFESYHHSGLKKHRTAVYVLIVTEEHSQFPEARLGRTRKWFSMEEALRLLSLHRPVQSAYLQVMMMAKLDVSPS